MVKHTVVVFCHITSNLLNSTRCMCSVSLLLVSVCAPLSVAALHFYFTAASVMRTPPQQICKASIFAGCWSTMQQFSTEQIERDRKLDTDTTVKHPVNFRIKHSMLMPGHISLNFINKPSLIAETGLKPTNQRFSESLSEFLIVSWLQLSGCAALWNAAWTQPVGVDGQRSTEQTCNGAVLEPISSLILK